jgi:hypothetical protein
VPEVDVQIPDASVSSDPVLLIQVFNTRIEAHNSTYYYDDAAVSYARSKLGYCENRNALCQAEDNTGAFPQPITYTDAADCLTKVN